MARVMTKALLLVMMILVVMMINIVPETKGTDFKLDHTWKQLWTLLQSITKCSSQTLTVAKRKTLHPVLFWILEPGGIKIVILLSWLNGEWAVTETKHNDWYDETKWWKVSFSEMKMRRIKVT
ncbi:hypothetical protein PoB_005704700 [Plakobranchus ocellatus]|uniref:Uncharacterized protein n=1 Tax=Plakobranchus ocellatus TaxID=259542 RepID=A0AAV4CGX9_9GAST|nr:hypothetical protein PoB_005704700 [Plakobranchus ocellatus]